jgi:hypothetical protein
MSVFPLVGWVGSILPHWGQSGQLGGSDLLAPAGTRVQAINPGIVTFAGYDPIGGNAVQIHGSDGLDYYYAHLQALPSVIAGQAVQAGTALGLVGNTGDAAGGPTHLHIGIGYGISTGSGAGGGLGQGFDAVSFLKGLLTPSSSGGSSVAGTKLTPAQIANYAAQAGFTGLGLVTAVAVALAESAGGNTNAWNQVGEDSRGLWQINVAPNANPSYGSSNLFDPLTNAKAAYALSNGGTDWHLWTTFTGGAYKTYLAVATAAVSAMGTPLRSLSPSPFRNAQAGAGSGIGTPLGAITIPAVPDIPGAITGVGNGLIQALQQLSQPVVTGVNNLNQLAALAGSGSTWVDILMVVLGVILLILGVILFAVSLMPSSVQAAARKAVPLAAAV